ncbi:hypothetical protein RF11_02607 [Thelohanellus kitauei]|uniref:Generative cell specific-1/HAP2 domain-containing protein n=1 Tax=Thelohanellus kitauei TaxID=669202 RepID=A0A0C2MIS5_THEKT|nr:hypothetical protein RF11_02607 [Thelohanellus kitauei]
MQDVKEFHFSNSVSKNHRQIDSLRVGKIRIAHLFTTETYKLIDTKVCFYAQKRIVNLQPKETIFTRKPTLSSIFQYDACPENILEESVCNVKIDGKEQIENFDQDRRDNTWPNDSRVKFNCLQRPKSLTIHCLRFRVYLLSTPSLNDFFEIEVVHKNQIFIELIGNLGHRHLNHDFKHKLLLVPIKNYSAETLKEVEVDALAVPQHMVDLTGLSCNKIGVSATGFRSQGFATENPCHLKINSCLNKQPIDLIRLDQARLKRGLEPKFKISTEDHVQFDQKDIPYSLSFFNNEPVKNIFQILISATKFYKTVQNYSMKTRILSVNSTPSTPPSFEININIINTCNHTFKYNIQIADCLLYNYTISEALGRIEKQADENYTFILTAKQTINGSDVCNLSFKDLEGQTIDVIRLVIWENVTCNCPDHCVCECNNVLENFCRIREHESKNIETVNYYSEKDIKLTKISLKEKLIRLVLIHMVLWLPVIIKILINTIF